MKTVKDLHHGFLLKCFGLGDRFYLALSVMTFFAFDDPDNVLSEQQLWPFVQNELGKETIFDAAMPKPNGEVLVWGRCFAPGGKPMAASQVGFQIGPVRKTAYVFGDRYWKTSGVGSVMTGPEPFTEMPVVYERAFGGTGFEKNPSGKGMEPIIAPSGEKLLPLPNIEDPRHLIAAPGDHPEPAGFGPLDAAVPKRAKKLGTYDPRWLRESWPFYPDDMDWTYFNTTPDDQQMTVFFTGDETFNLANMHRDKPLLQSRLPRLRQRLFINQLKDKEKPAGEKIFREVITHIDTVWLFPHAERGVMIHRGSVEVTDDEAADVAHIYITTEIPSEPAKTIDEHHAEFTKKLEKKIPETAVAAKEKASKKVAEAAERLKDLPREIADSFAAQLGKRPSAVRTHSEVIADLSGMLDRQGALIEKQEKKLLAAKAASRHLAKIDIRKMQKMREANAAAKEQLAQASSMIEKSASDYAAAHKEMQVAYKKALGAIDLKLIKEKGIDPDIDFDVFKKTQRKMWHERGMRFIERCRDDLYSHPEYLDLFVKTGLRPYTIRRSWLGIHVVEENDDPSLWGWPAGNGPKTVHLPPGIVIPCFDGARLERIMILSFSHIYPPPDFPQLTFRVTVKIGSPNFVEGSTEAAMVHGPDTGKPFIRVSHDLEALILNQELGDLCAVISMKSPDVEPDKETTGYLKNSPLFLIMQYPGSENPADTDVEAWKARYPQAVAITLPRGANVFEAKKQGVDIWEWVAEALKPAVTPGPRPAELDITKPGSLAAMFSSLDMAGMIKKTREKMMARMKPELDLMEKKKQEALDTARKALGPNAHLVDKALEKASETSAAEEANPFASMQGKYAAQFSGIRSRLGRKNALTADTEAKLAQAEKECADMLAKAAVDYEKGMARLASLQGGAAMPDWAKKLLAQAGFNPDDPAPLKRLTREEVIERHASGKGLAAMNLSGLDLSGLDLTGAIMPRANLRGTVLKDCRLDGADLTGANASGADCTKASMKNVRAQKGLFSRASLEGADLSGSDFAGALLNDADMTNCLVRETILEKVSLSGAKLDGSDLTGARCPHAIFTSVSLRSANLSGADLSKALFSKSDIAQSNFSGAVLRSTLFAETKGEKVNFSGADMFNSRILKYSAMAGSNFTKAKADKACWIKADLSGCDLRGATMKKALVQECNLSGADLTGVRAREARFTKTDLTAAKMEKLSLFRGSFRKSRLVHADLGRANLYGAEFYRTEAGDTHLDGANLKMTKLEKFRDIVSGNKDKG